MHIEEFTGTPTVLDAVLKRMRSEGCKVKVKRLKDLDDGERLYKLKVTPPPGLVQRITDFFREEQVEVVEQANL